MDKKNKDFFRGCLIGGAIGDALGMPIEFMDIEAIKRKYGESGINKLQLWPKLATITDDTQMTLFTAEGILRAETRGNQKGICDPQEIVHFAYHRWLYTQGYPKIKSLDWIYNGYLLSIPELFHQRAPGNSCLSALQTRKLGTIEKPINNSKGCGSVMRMAPVGLFYSKHNAFIKGMEFGALTHGHPTGYLAAGAFAYIIAAIVEGLSIEESVLEAIKELEKYKNNEECVQLLNKSLEIEQTDIEPEKAIPMLGGGWIAEEALAIAVYCSLKFKDNFAKGTLAAVNHSGDSDSTGAIAGNILGTSLGIKGIPEEWVEVIEIKEVIIEISDDLLKGYEDSSEWCDKYPGC